VGCNRRDRLWENRYWLIGRSHAIGLPKDGRMGALNLEGCASF